jgi:hypothetical protein
LTELIKKNMAPGNSGFVIDERCASAQIKGICEDATQKVLIELGLVLEEKIIQVD